MKPTEAQLLRIIDTYQNNIAGMEDSMAAAIQKWESVRPKDDPDRWIPLTERHPTAEDADECDCVFAIFADRSVSRYAVGSINRCNSAVTHWRRTNLPQPTAEEIEEKEIADGFSTSFKGNTDFDSFKAGWLACKSKLKTP